MKIKKYLLNLIGENEIWKYILEKADFKEIEDAPREFVWRDVFNKIPDFKKWLKNREIVLLKNLVVSDKSADFIKGQLMENRIYQHFDTAPAIQGVKVENKEINIPDKKTFLNTWNQSKKTYANTGEEKKS